MSVYLIVAIGLFMFVYWSNIDWYKRCRKMNDDWYEHCLDLNNKYNMNMKKLEARIERLEEKMNE